MSFLSSPRRFVPMAFLGAVAATMLQGAAFAATPAAAHTTVTVSYADLNLADPTHVAEFDKRIAKAAKRACAAQNWCDLKSMSEAPGCREAAIANARGKRDVAVAAAESRQQLAARSSAAQGTN